MSLIVLNSFLFLFLWSCDLCIALLTFYPAICIYISRLWLPVCTSILVLTLKNLTSLQNCSDYTFSLRCGLQFSLCVSNSVFTVSHVSCSSVINVCINCNPSLLSYLLLQVHFCVIYLRVFSKENICYLNFSKFLSSAYLPFAFLLKTGYLWKDLILCQMVSGAPFYWHLCFTSCLLCLLPMQWPLLLLLLPTKMPDLLLLHQLFFVYFLLNSCICVLYFISDTM